MSHFPIIKLGILAAKQISKPLTNVIKQTANSNDAFRMLIVSPTAQIYHWIGVRCKMHMLGLNQPKFVPPLNKSMAIQTGSDILGELVIFTIGVSLLILEYSRQSRKDSLKNEKQKEDKEKLNNEITVLNERVLSQSQQIQLLKTKLRGMGESE